MIARSVGIVLALAATMAGLSACAGSQGPKRASIAVPSSAADDELGAVLLKARAALDARRPTEAIEHADQIISHYEREYPQDKKRVYCARSQTEVVLYMVTAANDGVNAIALNSTWSAAYYLKAFALVELGKVADARDALERARVLSPQNSQILSELAYVHMLRGDNESSFATYALAEKAAEFSPADAKVEELTRALRGQGFLLTDHGRLDEAEAKYRKCLELNPDDPDAKRELDYIAKLRRR